MKVAEDILADALVSTLLLSLEEEMILAILVLHDVCVDGRSMKVEEHLRFALQVREVCIGISPIHTVVGNGAVVGEEREVDHILASLLVVNGLRCPDTCDVGKVLARILLREVYGMVLPMYEVARLEEHDATIACPS